MIRQRHGGETEPHLRALGDAIVPQQVLEEQEQVGHEAGELAGSRGTSEREQDRDRHEPDAERDREPDEEPVQAHDLIAPRARGRRASPSRTQSS